MQIYLATDRLILRQLTMDDVDHLVKLDSDPEVMRYLAGTPTPRETIERDLLPWWPADYERGDRYGFWAAIEQQTGDFIGWFHLRPGPDAPHDEPGLGYRLRLQAWGKRYATEGARALVRKGFTDDDIRRVTATTVQDNRRSRRVLEKSGLRVVRAFRLTPEERHITGFLQSGRATSSSTRSSANIGGPKRKARVRHRGPRAPCHQHANNSSQKRRYLRLLIDNGMASPVAAYQSQFGWQLCLKGLAIR